MGAVGRNFQRTDVVENKPLGTYERLRLYFKNDFHSVWRQICALREALQ